MLSKDWEEVSLGPDATFLLLSGLLLLPGGQLGSHHSVVVVVKALTRGKMVTFSKTWDGGKGWGLGQERLDSNLCSTPGLDKLCFWPLPCPSGQLGNQVCGVRTVAALLVLGVPPSPRPVPGCAELLCHHGSSAATSPRASRVYATSFPSARTSSYHKPLCDTGPEITPICASHAHA